MLNRYLKELLLGFAIILFADNALAAESLENERKIQQFKIVNNKIYEEYFTGNIDRPQYVVIIHNDFSLSYEKRDCFLRDLYSKILNYYKEVFAIAYMNSTNPFILGFIIVDKDFCPEIKSEINKLSIPKINPSDTDDMCNFITAIDGNNSTIFVPEMQTKIVENDSILFTTKVRDCVAVTFQGISKKTGNNAVQLAHFYREQCIKEFFKASLDHFKPENTQVNIISNCYSQHLLNLIYYLGEKGFQINGLYVPEIEVNFIDNGDNLCLVHCYPISMFEIGEQSLVVGLQDAKLYFNYDEIIAKQIKQNSSSLNNIGSKEMIFGVAILAGIYYFLGIFI